MTLSLVVNFIKADILKRGKDGAKVYDHLTPKGDDQSMCVIGEVSVRDVGFTRDCVKNKVFFGMPCYAKEPRRTFKPGLMLDFQKESYCLPDITFRQFGEAVRSAVALPNGLIQVDLESIQRANQENADFPSRQLGVEDVADHAVVYRPGLR